MTASNLCQFLFLIVLIRSLQVVDGVTNNTAVLACVEPKHNYSELRHNQCVSVLPKLLELLHQANLTVHFCTTHLQLNTSIHFQGLYDVSFIGDQRTTVIDCSLSHDAGVSFNNSENIYLENLVFENCGTLQESTSVDVITGAALLFDTSL